jgi:phage shock protein PspC (stress-responsive transcriptional regulator)
MKRLTRTNEKVIAGVLGGISNYLNPELDPVICRVIFLCFAFFNPALILVYFGLVFIMPAEAVNVSNSSVHS